MDAEGTAPRSRRLRAVARRRSFIMSSGTPATGVAGPWRGAFRGCVPRCSVRRKAEGTGPSFPGGSRGPREMSGPRKPRCDSARSVPFAGLGGGGGRGANGAPTTSRRARRYARHCNSLGNGRGGSADWKLHPGSRRDDAGCNAAARGRSRGLFRERAGRPAPPPADRAGAGAGPAGAPGPTARNGVGIWVAFPESGPAAGPRRAAATLVDTRREPNLSCGVAERSSIQPRRRHGRPMPAERSMRAYRSGDSLPRLRRPACAGRGPVFPRPEPLPGHPNEGPNPA